MSDRRVPERLQGKMSDEARVQWEHGCEARTMGSRIKHGYLAIAWSERRAVADAFEVAADRYFARFKLLLPQVACCVLDDSRDGRVRSAEEAGVETYAHHGHVWELDGDVVWCTGDAWVPDAASAEVAS